MLVFSWLSAQQSLDDVPFECCLILEYKNNSQVDVIDINDVANNDKTWLDLARKEKKKNSKSISLFLSYLIDIDTLSKEEPELAQVYLWASTATKRDKVHLETIYPLSGLPPAPSTNLNKIFIQLYPVSSTKKSLQRYYEIENKRIDSEGFPELLKIILEQSEKKSSNKQTTNSKISLSAKKPKTTKRPTPEQFTPVTRKSMVAQKPTITREAESSPYAYEADDEFSNIDSISNADSTDGIIIMSSTYIADSVDNPDITVSADDTNSIESLEIDVIDTGNADVTWGIFSKQDLDDLVEGFKDWERVHGKNTLLARLPKSLVDKIGGEFDIVFWTSGQGISNMVVDDRPPRHTMVMGLVKSAADTNHGIGYCIQRPTSLDKIWTHNKWHNLKCDNNEILEVIAAKF